MHPELKWFLLLIIGLWLAWFVTGGPSSIMYNRTHPFLEQPSEGGQPYTVQELKNGTRP